MIWEAPTTLAAIGAYVARTFKRDQVAQADREVAIDKQDAAP